MVFEVKRILPQWFHCRITLSIWALSTISGNTLVINSSICPSVTINRLYVNLNAYWTYPRRDCITRSMWKIYQILSSTLPPTFQSPCRISSPLTSNPGSAPKDNKSCWVVNDCGKCFELEWFFRADIPKKFKHKLYVYGQHIYFIYCIPSKNFYKQVI